MDKELDYLLVLCNRIRWNISTANNVGVYDVVREIEKEVEKLKQTIELSVNRSR
jgi:hypothetical protein